MEGDTGPSGEALLVLAAIVSLQRTQGRSPDQIELLAAFFEVVGDNLSLIAARRSQQSSEGLSPSCGGAS